MKYKAMIDRARHDIAEAVDIRLRQLVQEMDRPPNELVLEWSIEELLLPVRTLNRLHAWRYQAWTVGDLVQCRRADLLKLRGFGCVSLKAVEDALAEHGLHLHQ